MNRKDFISTVIPLATVTTAFPKSINLNKKIPSKKIPTYLKKGDLVALEGGIPHDLKALETSTVRLSLNKADSARRVEDVAKNS